jgi:hypothetical protein
MVPVQNTGLSVTDRFLGAACFATVLIMPHLSGAWKDTAGLNLRQQHSRLRRG